MGLAESESRWFVELVFHKGHVPTDEEKEKYGITDDMNVADLHTELGCITSHAEQIIFARRRLQEAREDGTPEEVAEKAKILMKFMRGHYR